MRQRNGAGEAHHWGRNEWTRAPHWHRSRGSETAQERPKSPTPAAAKEEQSPEGKGAAIAALAQPLHRVTASVPAAGWPGYCCK